MVRVTLKKLSCGSWVFARRRLPLAFAQIFLAVLLVGCGGDDRKSGADGKVRYLADVPISGVPIARRPAPARLAAKVRTWGGSGLRDVCGKSWSIELSVSGNKVTGEFWLGGIKYDIIGFLDSSGKMDAIPGRKNKFYRNHIGPRQMEFNVTFRSGEAVGEHYFSYGDCLTPMRLSLTERKRR